MQSQLIIPGRLMALGTALKNIPGLTLTSLVDRSGERREWTYWFVELTIANTPTGVASLDFLTTMVSRAGWKTRSIQLEAYQEIPDAQFQRYKLSGAGEHADPDQLAKLIMEQQPDPFRAIRCEFAALSQATNRVNAARNSVGSLKFYLDDPSHQTQAARAFNLIVRAEGILEALRNEIPVYENGPIH